MEQYRYENLDALLECVTRDLIRDSDGLVFLRWLLGECGVFKSEYPESHARAAYFEGKREIGVRLLMLAMRAGAAEHLFRPDAALS